MKENQYLIDGIAKDMNLYFPTNKYIDDNRILNYNISKDGNLDLSASFKEYGDKVYNVWYNEDNFRFYGMKDLTIYDVYINNYSFFITEIKDNNGEACIKKIRFVDSDNKKSLSVENNYIDNPNNNEYISVDNYDDKLSLTTNNNIDTVHTYDYVKVEKVLKALLEMEESNIEKSFDLIHSSIPNFFDKIKYDFKVLKSFNNLYDTNKPYTENIMDTLINVKTKTK